ncbi:MAG: pyrroline-5-carboxylate reductase [Bradymonadia bacterium]
MEVGNAKHVGVIGFGVMTSAMIKRWLATGFVHRSMLTLSTRSRKSSAATALNLTCSTNESVVDESEIIILGIKPHQLAEVTRSLSFRSDQVVLTVLAGTPLESVCDAVSPARVVRCMPNLAVELGKGIVAEMGVNNLPREQSSWVAQAFGDLGTVVSLNDESQFDGITALAGSAPAFCFVLAQALADAGVLQGLTRAQSETLAARVLEGAGALISHSKVPPETLKDRVASPKGTTISGLRALEARGFRSAIIEAVAASAARSEQLSKG